ncbi:hypothetical protein, partial [Salmonella sp. s28719]|uniref:hypothetical protein n=1 Tax=Salmonella sp. s28719 TaxID=3159633 RepID=UPI0039804B9D
NNTAVGTFPDATTSERVELPINAKGEAFARIIPKGEGNLTLTAKIGEVERKAELSFFKKRMMVVDTTNAIADNYSVARIVFTGNATDINRDIVF